jgi:hypothetical protein
MLIPLVYNIGTMDNQQPHKCKVCKNNFSVRNYDEALARRLSTVGVCHGCDIWMGYFLDRRRPDSAVIEGQQYTIGPKNARFKGMGGNKVVIKFYDGRTVTTDNLWHNGKIPEIFKNIMPNNADVEAIK